MPIIKSAKKRQRQIIKKTIYNKAIKTNLKTMIKKFLIAPSEETFKTAQSKLACAARKGILHKNTAARKISALHRNLKAL